MKAATVSSGRSESESSRAVADESSMDVEGGERRNQKFDRTEHQATNRDENINGRVTNG